MKSLKKAMNKAAGLRACEGLLLLDKPGGASSHQALQKVKQLYRAEKAGHTGSLDPLATGMLPVCFGKTTKLASRLLTEDKYYQVTAILGMTTTTGDAEGEILSCQPSAHITTEHIEAALHLFRGKIQQIPPMYSALKFRGKPLYYYARKGIVLEREPREVTVHHLALFSHVDKALTLDVHCSKGTYIRSLVEDIGKYMGCGAYVAALRRYRISGLPERMFTFDELTQCYATQGLAGLDACLISVPHMTGVTG